MSKIMNKPEEFVDESLHGIVLAHGDMLKFAEGSNRAIVRADAPKANKVVIVTGGGYGHLPVFLGYVGKGFCDGVAVGNVFTSPSCDAIVEAAKAANGGAGVLFLFGNYMGDSMNFDMASEMLEMDDIPTAIVKCSDDVASAERSEYRERRGVAGMFFPYKLAGAMAERGASLEEVRAVAEDACANVATLGVAVSSCQLPGAAKAIFELPNGEMELGMGIHGEPGVERTTMKTSAELAETFCTALSKDLSLTQGSEIAVLVNGLGATSCEELYVLYGDLYDCAEKMGLKIKKVFVGEYATSLEMQGVSVSFLKLSEQFGALLDEGAHTPFVHV